MSQITKCPNVMVVLTYWEASVEVSELSYKSLLYSISVGSYCRTTNIQESRHKSRHRSASNLDKGHKSAPSWPSVEGEGGLSGNGAEPNCNSCYHGSSRQRGGADGSLGRFTTTEFYPKFRKMLVHFFTDDEVLLNEEYSAKKYMFSPFSIYSSFFTSCHALLIRPALLLFFFFLPFYRPLLSSLFRFNLGKAGARGCRQETLKSLFSNWQC